MGSMNPSDIISRLHAWEVLSRRLLIDCLPWLRLWRETVRLPDGREIDDYFQCEQQDYVEIVAWRGGKVLGLWRYKHGPRCVNLGLPAGYIGIGENALDAARRELQEEAGLASEHWRCLGSYFIDGNRSQARAHIYTASYCRSIAPSHSDDLETHIMEWLTPQEWSQYLAAGNIATLGAVVAVHAGVLAPSE
jgi:ADP-ribose pyrophosphatase